jgi:hypothetical protein
LANGDVKRNLRLGSRGRAEERGRDGEHLEKFSHGATVVQLLSHNRVVSHTNVFEDSSLVET